MWGPTGTISLGLKRFKLSADFPEERGNYYTLSGNSPTNLSHWKWGRDKKERNLNWQTSPHVKTVHGWHAIEGRPGKENGREACDRSSFLLPFLRVDGLCMIESLLDFSTQRKWAPLHHIHIITPIQTSNLTQFHHAINIQRHVMIIWGTFSDDLTFPWSLRTVHCIPN